MSKEYISSDSLVSSNLFSAAVKVGNFVFTSGQIALDNTTKKLNNISFEVEVIQCFKNIKLTLEASGLNLEDVIKVTVFLTDINLFNEFNEIYKKYFSKSMPARTLVEVLKLALGARIEIEVIAYK